jgi:GT2 family glycosyltransferase
MLLSVVVVNWNLRDELHACLTSLVEQSHRELEVIVVDNGSADGSAELVREQFPQFTLLPETSNLGFAEGCNRGIAVSHGEWVAMLNNDAVAAPDWAAELVRAAESAPSNLGMLQSLMLFKARPDVINSTGIGLAHNGGGFDRFEGRARSEGMQETDIFCVCAGAGAYRRSMLEQIQLKNGYFDRSHFMYSEDLDLGWRAQLAGWTAKYLPKSIVYHRYHGSSARHGKSWLQSISRTNRIRTLLKNASWPMLAKVSLDMLGDSGIVLWHSRARGFKALFGAVSTGLEARREVSALSRQERQRVEAKWLTPKGQ